MKNNKEYFEIHTKKSFGMTTRYDFHLIAKPYIIYIQPIWLTDTPGDANWSKIIISIGSKFNLDNVNKGERDIGELIRLIEGTFNPELVKKSYFY